jgi:hypothetical protein
VGDIVSILVAGAMSGAVSGDAPGVLGKTVAAGETVATPLGEPMGMALEAASGWAPGAETGDLEGNVTGDSIGNVATGPTAGVGTEERDGESVVPVTAGELTDEPAGTAAGEAEGAEGFCDESGEAAGVAPGGETGACACGALTRSSVGGRETGTSTGVPAAGRIVTGVSTGADAGVAAVGDFDATGRPTTGADVVMFTIGIPVGASTGAGAAMGLLLITGVEDVAFNGGATGAGGEETGGCRTEAIGETAIGGLSKGASVMEGAGVVRWRSPLPPFLCFLLPLLLLPFAIWSQNRASMSSSSLAAAGPLLSLLSPA